MENVKTNKKIYLEVLKYLCFFLLFFVLGKANISGAVYHFSFGAFLALFWCNQKVYFLAPIFVVANFLSSLNLNVLFVSLVEVFVILVVYLIHYKLRKPIKKYLLSLYSLLAQGYFLFYEMYFNSNFFFSSISVVVSVVFMYVFIQFFSAILLRGFSGRLTTDEIICGGIVLLVFFSGLAGVNVYGFEIYKLLTPFVILFSAYISGVSTSLFCSVIMGLGIFVSTLDFRFLAVFVVWAVSSSVFKVKARYLPALAIVIVEFVLGFFLKIYNSYQIINFVPVVLGCFSFVVFPQNTISKVSEYFTANSDRFAVKNIVNRNRTMVSRKLGELSCVFMEMDSVFRNMIRGGLTTKQAKQMLSDEVKEKICEECSERNKCHRVFEDDTRKVFSELISASFERGKATLIDVPPFLTTRCNKINLLISTINTLSAQYQKYAGYMKNLDSSKILLAEQLGGISKVLKSLSQDVNKNISFDTVRENKLVNELTYHNIICFDAVVFEQNLDVQQATLVVKNEDAKNPALTDIVSKICGSKMVISSEELSPRSGLTILNFITAPKYEILFGTAGATKATSKVSGDSYSIIKIDSDKFMMALCDGMGSGKKAESTSNLAMGLVENFYKAGFENDVILSSVNKLLTIGNEDVFSALDLLVVDLRKGIADVIKLGAPCGYVKEKNETKIVESGALPLGILQDIEPVSKKLVLKNGDYVVLCTDGISDSFKTDKELSDFINNLKHTNPQKMAESILEKALENCGGSAIDDMTIIVAKIFKV